MRKHDNFSYTYGWRTAPEQWNFYHNDKLIELDNDVRNSLACMCIAGDITEAENELKRIIRKRQTQIKTDCIIAFYGKDSSEYYYSKNLKANRWIGYN